METVKAAILSTKVDGFPSNIAIYVQGKMLNLNEALDVRLKDGDEIHLLEIVLGG